MTLNEAALELDGIRNDRTTDRDTLLARVDAIGAAIASRKYSKLSGRILNDCHLLADKLSGGTGKGGTRIRIEA